MKRPRRRVGDLELRWVVVASLLVPYIFLATLIAYLLGWVHSDGLPVVILFSAVALLESAYFVAWLQRPVRVEGRREDHIPPA